MSFGPGTLCVAVKASRLTEFITTTTRSVLSPDPLHYYLYQEVNNSKMSNEVFRELLADTISTMSTEELRNIIMNTPDKDLAVVGSGVLAEKRKRGMPAQVAMVAAEETEAAETSAVEPEAETSARKGPVAAKKRKGSQKVSEKGPARRPKTTKNPPDQGQEASGSGAAVTRGIP